MVFLALGFLVGGEEDGVDAVGDDFLFHGILTPGGEDGEAFDGAAFGIFVEEADDLVVRGILQAHDGGDALVGGAVDHDALVFVFLLDAAVEVVPDEDHRDADGDEKAEGQEDVDEDEQDEGRGIVPRQEGENEQQEGFEEGGAEEEDQVAHGEVADDDPVGAEDQEGREGKEGGADQVGGVEAAGDGQGE